MASLLRLKWPKRLATRTIARDLIFGLVMVVTLAAGGFIGLNYRHLSFQNQSQFQQNTNEYISYLEGALAAPIWNFDDETINQIAQSLMKNEIIAGMRISDYKQETIYEAEEQTRPGETLIRMPVDIMYRGKLAGHVELSFSTYHFQQRNRQLLVSSLLILVVILISLISVTGVLLKFLVRRPMNHVHQAISRIAQGDYDLRADMPPQAEIAQIVVQFNRMAEQVQSREIALSETNLRLGAILDNSTAVVYLKDVQGGYMLINSRFETLFHLDREAIVGQTDFDIFPHELAEKLYQNDQKVLADDAAIEFEESVPQDDGLHTYLSVKFPLKDSQGKIYAICGISTDITRRKVAEQEVRKLNQDLELRVERRTEALNQSNQHLKAEMDDRLRAEAALRNNEALLLATLESTVDGVLVIQNNEVTHANQRFWQLWNFPDGTTQEIEIDDIRAHIANLLTHPEKYLERASRLYQSQEEALDIVDLKDGRVFERFSCALNIDGEIQGRVWCFRDISDKKHAEEVMAQAKDVAEAANRAKSEFLASMSHEIRTPMNGVMGMSGLLLETDLDKEQREYANTIQSSADSLLAIINDILDFSKIEAGKLELETLDFDLSAAVEEVVDMLALGAHQKGLEFGSLIHPDVPQYLRGDPGRLRQVIVNLVSNAIKFTEKGHVALQVELESETEAMAILRFTVNDTGPGIPDDRMDRLFKSFSQLDASTTRKFGGTGLGLAISKELAHLLGGQIGVETVQGQGATFWFTAALQKQQGKKAYQPPTLQDMRGKRILVVDDNAINLEIICAYLKSWGCYYASASDAAQALKILHRAANTGKAFDMSIIDHMMPDMDGASLALAIKADPKFKAIKMAMLSSASLRGDISRAKELGFDAYLTKPIKRKHLYQCISALLGEEADDGGFIAKTDQTARERLENMKQHNIRVLVVEDNATNQKVAQHMLQRIGVHTDVAGNGLEAIQAFEQIPYNFILMDVQMPVMDGLTAARKIRSLEARSQRGPVVPQKRTPIVALTANVIKGHREKCLAAGMDDFLAKPINPDELWEKLEHWVIEKKRGNPPSKPEKVSEFAATRNDHGAVFDLQSALARAMGDAGFLKTLLDEFQRDRDRFLTDLTDAVEKLDANTLQKTAHALKGAAANLGAQKLAEAAYSLENSSRDLDLDSAATAIDKVRAEFDRLASFVESSDWSSIEAV